jgi:hypothetical protein
MNYPLWFGNLAAYSLQITALVLGGSLAWALLRLKQPRAITPVKAKLDALGIVEFVSLDKHRAAVAIMDAHQAQLFKG